MGSIPSVHRFQPLFPIFNKGVAKQAAGSQMFSGGKAPVLGGAMILPGSDPYGVGSQMASGGAATTGIGLIG